MTDVYPSNGPRGKLIDHKFRVSCKPSAADGSARNERGKKIIYYGWTVSVYTEFGGYDAVMPVQLSKIDNIHASGTLQRRDPQEGCKASGWKSLPQQFGIGLEGTTTGEQFTPPLTAQERSAVLIVGRENSTNNFSKIGVVQPSAALPAKMNFDGRTFKFAVSNVTACSVDYQIDEE